jgi:hypothetical protein
MVVAPVAVALNITNGAPCGPTSDALKACEPSTEPRVQVALASPFASVVAVAGITEPPAVTVNTTTALGTATSFGSATRTTTACGKGRARTVDWASPETFASFDAASDTAVKVIGLPARPGDDAVTVCDAPGCDPSVHDASAAMPLASLITTPVGDTDPPPATVNVTGTLGTGVLSEARTITDGGCDTGLPADPL